MKKRILAALLCGAIAFGVSGAVGYAYDETKAPASMSTQISPRYVNFGRIWANLSFDGNTAECSGLLTVIKAPSSDLVYEMVLTLQRSSDNRSWSDVESWISSAEGAGNYNLKEYYYVSSGYYYRTSFTVTVWDGNDVIETASVDSNSVRK